MQFIAPAITCPRQSKFRPGKTGADFSGISKESSPRCFPKIAMSSGYSAE